MSIGQESTGDTITESISKTHILSDLSIKDDRTCELVEELNFVDSSDDSDNGDQVQTALILENKSGPYTVDKSYPIPDLKPNEILIKIQVIGLNPLDWKSVRYGFGIHSTPWINGREGSGTIVKTSEGVNGLEVGDNVFICSTSYRDIRTSTFQEYVIADYRLVWKIPSEIDLLEAATLGVGLVTAGVVIFNNFKLLSLDHGSATVNENLKPETKSGGNTILIWGGSSVVGMYLIQLIVALGNRVITVAGSKNKDYLKSLGADVVIDRHQDSKKILEDIRLHSSEGITHAVDTVSRETSELVLVALKQNKPNVDNYKQKVAFLVSKPKQVPSDIDIQDVAIKSFHEDTSFGTKLVEHTTELLREGKVYPVRYKLFNEGLEDGINKGLEYLETFGASGEKIIVKV